MRSLQQLILDTTSDGGRALLSLEDAAHGSVLVRGAQFDSRKVTSGDLFVALVGASVDGHDFLQRAADAGASAALVQRDHLSSITTDLPLLVCEDTRAVLGEIGAILYGRPLDALTLVGITGTNGKTTTSFILEALLAAAGKRVGVIGTVNYRWPGAVIPAPNTTPESLILQQLAARMVADDVDTLVMEVSSHGLATHRLRGVAFDVAIWTNLTQDHLDFHGSMEAYREAKERLFFEHLREDGLAIINVDDAAGANLAARLQSKRAGLRVLTYALGDEGRPDAFLLEASETLEGIAFHANSKRIGRLRSPMLGSFNMANTLAAALVAAHLAEPGASSLEDVLQEGLDNLGGVPGRLERVNPGEQPAVFVDYAHTPDALERALRALSPHCEGTLHAVFGCGGDRDRGKRPLMGEVAARIADRLMVTSDNPRSEDPGSIMDAVFEGIPAQMRSATAREVSRAAAIQAVILEAEREDVILIAGKGHETYQELATGRIDFDDREHARAALAERARQTSPQGGEGER